VAPENTLAAFRRAITDGADAIELDVRLTSDGEVVVIHDSRLERTTNGRGWVERTTLADLQRLSAGAWFHRKFSGERIPTLAEVLRITRTRIGVNIEIKNRRSGRKRFDIVERTCAIVEDYGSLSTVLISSFNHAHVKRVREIQPKILTGVLYHPVKHFRRSPSRLAAAAGAGAFICSKNVFRSRTAIGLASHRMLSGVYSINDARTLRRVLTGGANLIYSDRVADLRRLLDLDLNG